MTPITPLFTLETATAKVPLAEDAWNRCDSERVSMAPTADPAWRNPAHFPQRSLFPSRS